MNTLIKVSTHSITNDAEKIEQLVNTVPDLFKQLEASMEKLSACWEGAAWCTYQHNMTTYMEQLMEIYKYMKKYTKNIYESGEEYQRAEQDVCAMISRSMFI